MAFVVLGTAGLSYKPEGKILQVRTLESIFLSDLWQEKALLVEVYWYMVFFVVSDQPHVSFFDLEDFPLSNVHGQDLPCYLLARCLHFGPHFPD